jgi:Undecaprenyl-phosphate galactose phosphotransferase WbaP
MVSLDMSALVLAGIIAYLVWALPMREQSAGLYLELAPLTLLFILGYARAGLYPGLGLGPVETLRRLSLVTTFGFLVLAAFSFALKLPHLYSRVTFLIAYVAALLLLPLVRFGLFVAARNWRWWAEPVVVIGTGRRAARAIRGIMSAGHLGYRPVAVLTSDGVADAGGNLEGIPIVGGVDRVPELSARGIRVAFLEVDQLQTRSMLDRLQQAFQHVILLREFDDLPVEGLQVRNLGSLVGIEYTNNLLRRTNQTAKRALDLAVGSMALVVATPIIIIAALTVRLIDGGPSFFHQNRTGLGGRRIRVPKIRTMRRDADKQLDEYLTGNPALREEWETRYKLRDDPRLIPAIGRVFRRFSIDELPQLWAVVIGDMSLVGPRPFPDYHLQQFTPAFLELRQRVRPGITGLWQIQVRGLGDTDDQEAFDSYYIRNWSVWFDLYLLGRTAMSVASGRGAY